MIPTTNPTSTAAFKDTSRIEDKKCYNTIPSSKGKKSTIETARIALREAVKYGAPEGIIGWIEGT